jgi:hypothetical protein
VRPLGSGGSGSVWLACDERTGLDVALKIVSREGKAAARAEREVLATRRLRHERCVRVYDVGHDPGHIYIAYEYVPGRTVRDALAARALSDRDAVEIAAQVLDALAHAHRAGILHRDVKPSNVLLEDREAVAARLLDFGLAQFDGADTLTAAGDVPGTLAYISPERLAGEEAVPESDVWSVGVVLWEALAGRHPFWGLPLQEVARAIDAGAPPLASERPDLPRRLTGAVDAALIRDPDARPKASALAADLRSVLETPKGRASDRPIRLGAPVSGLVSQLAVRILPALLASATAAIGATLLPFWPAPLAAAIALAAGVGAVLEPRLGLAIALAAPVFPFGNASRSAAIVYGAFAILWFLFSWRSPRTGLLFITGPLLAPLGAVALVPLAVQFARRAVQRAAQGALAVLAASLAAALPSRSLGITPNDGVHEAADTLLRDLVSHPTLIISSCALAAVCVVLPWARKRVRLGVALVGAALVTAAIAAGGELLALPLVIAVWSLAAVFPTWTDR